MQGEGGKSGKPAGPGKPAKSASSASKRSSSGDGNTRMLRFGIVALALLVGVIAWVATRGDDEETTSASSSSNEARIVSVDELEEFAASATNPVYWAGALPAKEIELTESAAGNVQIRYLDEGTEAGGGSAGVLTIGSYPLPDAEAALEGFADRKGSIVRRSPGGREVVTSLEKPTSVYFTGSDGSIQVEVYDPSYKRAMSLALSDQVRPVG